jgi:large subunit ribosomal protein L15
VTKKFSLKVNGVSASAKEKLEKAGGSIEILPGKVYPARNSAKEKAKAEWNDKAKTAKPAAKAKE